MIGLIPFLIIGLVFSEVYLKKNNDISQENETNQVSVETTIETKPPEIKLEPEVVEIKEEKPPEEPQQEVKTEEPPQEEVKTEEPPQEEVKTEELEEVLDEKETSWLKIILYILGGILIFATGAYFFINRGKASNQTAADIGRQESNQESGPEQIPDPEPTPEPESEQPAQDEAQTETTQEESSQPDNADTSSNNDDENNNR